MTYKIKILLITLLLSTQSFAGFFSDLLSENKESDAMPFGLISIPQPTLDELGEEGNAFFDEFSADVYSLYNNGIIQISSKYKVPVKIKDIEYQYKNKSILLMPNDENKEQIEAIDGFYSEFKTKGKKLLKQLANDNRVVAIAFGHIANSQVKRAIKNGTLQFAIKIFLYQSEATMYKTISINVESLANDPYYNPEELVIKVEKNILSAYEQVIATIQQSGNIMSSFTKSTSSSTSTKTETSNEDNDDEEDENIEENKAQAFKDLEQDTSDDDW